MVPKKILVATDGSAHAAVAVETALGLAERFGSSLGLLHVVDVRQLEGPFLTDVAGMAGMAPLLHVRYQVRELLTRKGAELLDAQAALCRARGIETAIELAEGVVPRVIVDSSRLHDLVCLGRHGEHARWRGLLMGSTVEEVARGSSRPVLVSGAEVQPFKRLLLAYDGSQAASAALTLAAEMAQLLGAALAVVTVNDDETAGEALLADARRFLQPHGLEVATLCRRGDPATAIAVAADEGYDLVIMGAWGHSRLREMVLGSTTAGVLGETTRPVLLYR